MLCGIGGNTIEAAQRSLSYQEVQKWAAYRRKRGTLHIGMRVERSAAMLASLYVNAHTKKGSKLVPIHDFMPHADEPELSLEDAMKTWR